MQALVLEKTRTLTLREIELAETLGPHDVRVNIHTVGVCGSDVHYYQHGAIGPFVVRAPMVLGHEAAGVVSEIGSAVTTLRPGDRVCMEPGVPDPVSRATRLGLYNLDPAVRFWATPPVHGCLRPSVVHPAAFTFRLPDNVSFGEGAMVEPLAVGLHAANKARLKPGDVAVVLGAGPIGMVTALAALAGARNVAASTPVEVTSARVALGQATARYQSGLAAVDDVAQAQRLLVQAQIDDALARLSVWRARLQVATARGDIQPFLAEASQ